jgi:hypothetical protein
VVFAVAIDAIFVAIGVIGVGLVITAIFRAWHGQHAQPEQADGWRSRVAGVCAAGREVVDLTVADDEAASGTMLTVDRLSTIETKLDLLSARIGEVQATAPTPDDARQMRLVELHVSSLNETVRTMRRVRLTSAASTSDQSDTLGLQLVTHRSALDDVLREISRGTGETR